MIKSVFIFCLICCLGVVGVCGKSYTPAGGIPFSSGADDHCFQRVSDTTINLFLSQSNRMVLGKPFAQGEPFPDDEEIVDNLPYDFNVCFPAGSSSEYLNAAGLWIGGIKGNDTLVAQAFDYGSPFAEFSPASCPDGKIITSSGIADIEYIAMAVDTAILGDTLFRCYFGGCHDWYPLGLSVTSHSYRWVSPPYDNIVIVDYRMTNIDSMSIEQAWAGIYTDCDIGCRDSLTTADDVSGFIDGGIDNHGVWRNLSLAYSMDMDGDPGAFGFSSHSTTGAFGVQVLGLDIPDYRVNFNWWVTEGTTTSESAPRQDESPLRDLGDSFAVARGDSNKYYLLSHSERDYNQVEAGLNHNGWIPPETSGIRAADGGDTRFLISAGPFDLQPGETVTFSVAYIAADNVLHNPYVNLWFAPQSPLVVADYYEVLDFQDFIATALVAQDVYLSHFSLPPPGPPQNVHVVDYTDTSVTLNWNKKQCSDLFGYRIYWSFGGDCWETALNVLSPDDTVATIAGLIGDSCYAFSVASVDIGQSVGKRSESISLVPIAPHPPALIVGNGKQAYPVLSWPFSDDSGAVAYRLYRIDDRTDSAVLVVETADTVYVDYDADYGVGYTYYVTSVNEQGIESIPVDSVFIIPLPMTSGILVIDQNSRSMLDNLVFDHLFFDTLIERSLSDYSYRFVAYDSEAPLTLRDIADYSLVVISSENRGGCLEADLADILALYLANGGNVIFLLRQAAIDVQSEAQAKIVRFDSQSLFSKYLFIDSAYIGATIVQSGYQLAGDLIGAVSMDGDLPSLVWDSTKANEFGYLINTGLPYSGFIWPRPAAEVIYEYQSSNTDSLTSLQANGIRYRSENYQFYLLNFPVSLMGLDSAVALMQTMVRDLGIEAVCGDINKDYHVNVGDIVAYIRYLYFSEEPPGIYENGDINCDSDYSLADVVILINYLFSRGLAPACCD